MLNNDILKSLRYILNVHEEKLVEIFQLVDLIIDVNTVKAYFKKEDEIGYQELDSPTLVKFLDGLIIFKRGAGESSGKKEIAKECLSNNLILKRLRIAFKLKDEDIIKILQKSNFVLTKAELGAFFRNVDHPKYKKCGDQYLRNFLHGMAK